MLAGRTVAQRFVAPARRCSGAVPASRMVGSRTKIDANPTSVPTINSIRFPPTAPAAEGSKAFSANIVGKASYTDADSSGYFQWASIATSAAVATLVAAAAAAAAATVSAVKGQVCAFGVEVFMCSSSSLLRITLAGESSLDFSLNSIQSSTRDGYTCTGRIICFFLHRRATSSSTYI